MLKLAVEHADPMSDGGGTSTVGSLRRPAPLLLLVVLDVVALVCCALVLGLSLWLGFVYIVCLCALFFGGEYRYRLNFQFLESAPRLAGRLAVPVFVLITVGLLVDVPRQVLVEAPVVVAALVVGRAVAFPLIKRERRRGRMMSQALILGAGRIGAQLYRSLQEHPEYGLWPVGIVDDVPSSPEVPVIGPISSLGDLLTARGDVSHVIVAFGPTREAQLVEVLRSPMLDHVDVHLVPRFFELGLAPMGPGVDSVWGIPLYRIRGAASLSPEWPFKRIFDVMLSLALIVLVAPVMVVLAAAVRLGSPGPVLFRQSRIGQRGQEFEFLKFRTLPFGHVDRKLNADDDEYRIPIGRFLRRTSLDELPQLFNVLRGDMTLVGPRPERGYLVERFNSDVHGYKDRHRLPMGITGLAQVSGFRGNGLLEERARFDNHYIEHWSLWRDFTIVVRTAAAMFRPGSKETDLGR